MKSGQCQDCKPHFYFFRSLVRWLLEYFLLCDFFFLLPLPFLSTNCISLYSQVIISEKYLLKKLLGKIPDASFLHLSEKF